VWRRTGIAPDTLSRIEDGRPEHVRPRTLERLAKAIGVEPERLRKAAS
jgi:DNA-binding Xre family transcriptional regulator